MSNPFDDLDDNRLALKAMAMHTALVADGFSEVEIAIIGSSVFAVSMSLTELSPVDRAILLASINSATSETLQ